VAPRADLASHFSPLLCLSVGPGYQLVCFRIREHASDPSQKPALNLQTQSVGSRWRLEVPLRDRDCAFHSPFITLRNPAIVSGNQHGTRFTRSHAARSHVTSKSRRRAPPSWSPHHLARVPLTGSLVWTRPSNPGRCKTAFPFTA